jgi:hypothetical protein
MSPTRRGGCPCNCACAQRVGQNHSLAHSASPTGSGLIVELLVDKPVRPWAQPEKPAAHVAAARCWCNNDRVCMCAHRRDIWLLRIRMPLQPWCASRQHPSDGGLIARRLAHQAAGAKSRQCLRRALLGWHSPMTQQRLTCECGLWGSAMSCSDGANARGGPGSVSIATGLFREKVGLRSHNSCKVHARGQPPFEVGRRVEQDSGGGLTGAKHDIVGTLRVHSTCEELATSTDRTLVDEARERKGG